MGGLIRPWRPRKTPARTSAITGRFDKDQNQASFTLRNYSDPPGSFDGILRHGILAQRQVVGRDDDLDFAIRPGTFFQRKNLPAEISGAGALRLGIGGPGVKVSKDEEPRRATQCGPFLVDFVRRLEAPGCKVAQKMLQKFWTFSTPGQ